MGRKPETPTTPDMRVEIVRLRSTGMTRNAIAERLGVPPSRIKTVLSEERFVLPMETRQANAYAMKLAKNPDAMALMRRSLTPEVVSRRNEAIRSRYENDNVLRALKGTQSSAWWSGLSSDEKVRYLDGRRSAIEASSGVSDYRHRFVGDKTFNEFIHGIAALHGGRCLDVYTGSKIPMAFECSAGHVFKTIPNVVQQGHWCPSCAHVGPSKGQLEVYGYVQALAPDVLLGDRRVIAPMELDVYDVRAACAVEYSGLYHHSDAVQTERTRHLRKALMCRAAGIKLLAVFEDEWRTKRPLVEAMIRWRLGRFSGVRLNARDLELVRLDRNCDFEEFFDRNHLDGHALASFAYGLRHNGRLVCCASYRTNFNGELEIARLATDYDVAVRGGAGRVIAAQSGDLITFSNNRLSDGAVYRRLGFEHVADNPPSYWYTDGVERIWRFRCRRRNDPEILAAFPTETLQARGGVFSREFFGDDRPLFKIYDYGHRKWRRVV